MKIKDYQYAIMGLILLAFYWIGCILPHDKPDGMDIFITILMILLCGHSIIKEIFSKPKSISNRIYNIPLDPEFDDDIYTLEEWEVAKLQGISNEMGCGFWVKDNLKSRDEVFSTPQLDATHITWYNK
jgi:hypothetical protein